MRDSVQSHIDSDDHKMVMITNTVR